MLYVVHRKSNVYAQGDIENKKKQNNQTKTVWMASNTFELKQNNQ